MGRRNSEVVDMDAEDDLAVLLDLVEQTGVEGGTLIAMCEEVGGNVVVEGLWCPVQAVQGFLEAPDLCLAFCCCGTESFWELNVDGLSDVCVEEGACHIQTVKDHTLLGRKCQHEVDGLRVDCGGIGVSNCLPL